jgi:type IV pilus biogenesis protein CpaD/CtpE
MKGQMKINESRYGWLKAVALAGIALGATACSSTEPDRDDFYAPTTHYERHPIIVTKTGVLVKECGRWPKDLTETSRNEQYENFGCAQQNNIAAMVADKDDLWRLRKMAPADQTRRSTLFDKYRQGAATAAAQEAQQKVTISNVGGGG